MARKKNENPNETKAEKFVRLGTARTGKALASIGSLEGLAGAGYESTAEQKAKIVTALQEALDSLKAVYEGNAKPGTGFSL